MDAVDAANFTALETLVRVDAGKEAIGKLINLVSVPKTSVVYQENLLQAITQLEVEKNVLSFADLVSLEKAVARKQLLHAILDVTPRRLLEAGWMPTDWKECGEFCDAVHDGKHRNDWLRAVRAECGVMTKAGEPAAAFDAGGYGCYV